MGLWIGVGKPDERITLYLQDDCALDWIARAFLELHVAGYTLILGDRSQCVREQILRSTLPAICSACQSSPNES